MIALYATGFLYRTWASSRTCCEPLNSRCGRRRPGGTASSCETTWSSLTGEPGHRRPVGAADGHRDADLAHPTRAAGHPGRQAPPRDTGPADDVGGPTVRWPTGVRGGSRVHCGRRVRDVGRANGPTRARHSTRRGTVRPVLSGLRSGEPVSFHGTEVTATDVTFLPTPVQRPRPPVWIGCDWPATRPLRRAARWDGVCPMIVNPADGSWAATPEVDLVGSIGAAGAAWWLEGARPGLREWELITRRIEAGPPR